MAKIRRISVVVFGKNEDVTINYVSKHKRFEAQLSGHMAEYAEQSSRHGRRIEATTEDLLREELTKFIREYEGANVKQRKVICYAIDWVSENIKSHLSDWRHGQQTDDKFKLEFSYRVRVEKSVNGNKRYYEEQEPSQWNNETGLQEVNDRYNDDDWVVIDWTEPRETFMKEFYGALEALVKKLEKVVGTDALMIAAIDKKLKLLEAR